MAFKITHNYQPINPQNAQHVKYAEKAAEAVATLGEDTELLMQHWGIGLDVTNELSPEDLGSAENNHARLDESIMGHDISYIAAIAFEEINHVFDDHLQFSNHPAFLKAVDQDIEQLKSKVLIGLAQIWSGSLKNLPTGESYSQMREVPAAEVLVDLGHCQRMLEQVKSQDEFLDKTHQILNSPDNNPIIARQNHDLTRKEIYDHLEDLVLGYKEEAYHMLKRQGVQEGSEEFKQRLREEAAKIRELSQSKQSNQIKKIKRLAEHYLELFDEEHKPYQVMAETFLNLAPQYTMFCSEKARFARQERQAQGTASSTVATSQPQAEAPCNPSPCDPSNVAQVTELLSGGTLTSAQLGQIIENLPERDPMNAEQGRAFTMLRATHALYLHANGRPTSIPVDEAAKDPVVRYALVDGKTALGHARDLTRVAIITENHEYAGKMKKVTDAITNPRSL